MAALPFGFARARAGRLVMSDLDVEGFVRVLVEGWHAQGALADVVSCFHQVVLPRM